MIAREQIYQTVTLILIVGLLDTLERTRPRFPVNRKLNLRLNIIAILMVIFGGELCKTALIRGFDALNLSAPLAFGITRKLPSVVKMLLVVVIADFCLYWVHRGMHRRRILWLTHVFHHSIDQLWWLSGSRTSMTHLLLFAAPQVFLVYYVFHFTPIEAGIAFSIGVIVNVWIHTNISVNLGHLEWLLITPNFHRMHHGTKGLAGKNLGFVLTVWDRMFLTYANPQTFGEDFALSSVSTHGRLLRMIAGI
jgi:sterol desaturase/sphingolipid hydroxylase (fatty acid hydroxylase superfamily)